MHSIVFVQRAVVGAVVGSIFLACTAPAEEPHASAGGALATDTPSSIYGLDVAYVGRTVREQLVSLVSEGDGAGSVIGAQSESGTVGRWRLHLQADGTYVVTSTASGQCLGIREAQTGDGAQAILWDCLGSREQAWTLRPYAMCSFDETETGCDEVALVDENSGKCLERANWDGTSSSVDVRQEPCDGRGHQAWSVSPVPPP